MKTYVTVMHAKKLTLLILLFITGCSSIPSVLYKIDVQQGNIITQDMVDKLRPGMSKSQVRFVLGTALIGDVFHKDRWDYVYRLVQHGNLVEKYKLTVFFEDDKLVRTAGDFSDSLASISPKYIVSGAEQGEESTLEETAPREQGTPTIIAIEDDTISSQYQDTLDIELGMPPPPPGISDGIEAD